MSINDTAADWTYALFKAKFMAMTGLDLDSYKDRQMERRIRQKMERHGCRSLKEFYALLETDSEVKTGFLNYLTINTSDFFRDPQVYRNLQETVFPELLGKYHQVNIWSAACSYGEEPYTVAIIMKELSALQRVNILATDIDDQALAAAARGVYTPRQLEKAPSWAVTKYFTCRDGEYYLDDEIKKAVRFKKFNLLSPHWEERQFQLILCRNVFIYFKQEIQERLIESFCRLLPEGGILVIGSAEYISSAARFKLNRRFHAIYSKSS